MQAAQVQKVDIVYVQLNLWQVLYRFLMFWLLVAVIVFDIIFLTKTNNDLFFDHFNVAISFLIIPFGLACINNLIKCKYAPVEAAAFRPFFRFIYYTFRLIGFEHFVIYLFTSFMRRSTRTLEYKLLEANIYHAVFGSQVVLWVQTLILFYFFNLNMDVWWVATPIILHAVHLSLLGADLRQRGKSVVMSFVYTFFHLDWFHNLFEGIGRALMIGITAAVFIEDPTFEDTDGGGRMTREAGGIDAISAGGFCLLVIFAMMILTGIVSGIFYGVTLFLQIMGYRNDQYVLEYYNSYQMRLSKKINHKHLAFMFYFPAAWRFCEIIAIFAYALDDDLYDRFDGMNDKVLRDLLLLAIIFNGIYLILILVEVFLRIIRKPHKKNVEIIEEKYEQKEMVENPTYAAAPALAHPMVPDSQMAAQSANKPTNVRKEELPIVYPLTIEEEALDFKKRNSAQAI